MAVITSGKTFANGEQLTADKLNQVITAATFNATDAVDGSTMNLIGGAMAVADGGISFSKLTDVIDDDTMATASSTKLATSESIKAYVDAQGIVQRTRVASGTNLTVLGSSVIPLDDTLPQSGEGTEVLTTSFTPKSTSNRIEVSFNGLIVSSDAGTGMVLALFEGTTCKAAKWFSQPGSGSLISHITFQFTPSSTDEATYSLRIGNGATVTNPLYVNRQSNATGTLGGLMEYSMTVLEVKS
jgi:hypothetical protein